MVKNILKLGIILLLICGISTGLLAYVNMLTSPVIAENEAKQQMIAKKEVLPQAETFEDGDDGVAIGKDSSGKTVGYTVMVSPSGYGGAISIMVGVNCDYTVSGVKILSLSETPGLGAKAQDDAFLSQYQGKEKSMELKRDITAISGATITSTAVTNGVKEALLMAEKIGGSK